MNRMLNGRRFQVARYAAATVALIAGSGAAADWPQFHGPRRDNVSDETGLLKQWPAEGPKLLWTATGIGEGFSSIAVADGQIYVTGNVGGDTVLTALGLDGKSRWTAKNGPADKHQYPGTRSTPTVDGDRVYHEGSYGDLVCLEAKTGKPRWSLNILAKFDGRSPRWGLSASPLVDGDRLICVTGGEKASLAALNKLTGETLWVCSEPAGKPGYGSPAAFDCCGVRQVVTLMDKSVVGVRADTGKLLWRMTHEANFDETSATPLFLDRYVLISTLTPTATQCLELSADGQGVAAKQVWQSAELDNHHGGVVLRDGYLYGSAMKGKWVCLEARSGRLVYKADGLDKGSVTYADGLFYTVAESGGTVGLSRSTPAGLEVISRFRLPKGVDGPVWAHPVVSDGRLYVRHGDRLYCYDVKGT